MLLNGATHKYLKKNVLLKNKYVSTLQQCVTFLIVTMEISSFAKKNTVICHIHMVFCRLSHHLFLISLLIWLTLTLSLQSTGPLFYQLLSLASEPRILSICLGDEGDFPGHLSVIDPSAVFKVLTLSLSAGLLKVTLALHCVNDAIMGQKPGIRKKMIKQTATYDKPLHTTRSFTEMGIYPSETFMEHNIQQRKFCKFKL